MRAASARFVRPPEATRLGLQRSQPTRHRQAMDGLEEDGGPENKVDLQSEDGADSTIGLPPSMSSDTPFDISEIGMFISCLVFLSIKTCKMCCHSSNEENPLLAGPYKASREMPCRPWFRGSCLSPKGLVCRLCEWAFYLGGFDLKYKNLDHLHEVMRSDEGGSLTDEWMAVLETLIDMVNRGQIGAKLRGSKRQMVKESASEARKKAVKLFQTEGTRAKEKFRAICLQKYLKKFPGSDPVADGHIVRKTLVPQRGWIDCVLMRKLPVDEWDVEVDADVRAMMSETHVTSNNQLRAGQVEDTFKALKESASGIAAESKNMKAFSSASSVSPLEKPKATSADKKNADEEGPEGDDDDDDSDDESSEEDPLAGTLLGGMLQPLKTGKKPKPKAGANPKAGAPAASPSKVVVTKRDCPSAVSPGAKRSKLSPQVGTKREGQFTESPAAKHGKGCSSAAPSGVVVDSTPRKGKGKAARIPTDISGLLAYEGFDVVEESVAELMAQLADENGPFEDVGVDAKVVAAFVAALQTFSAQLQKQIKQLQNMDVKMTKRQGTPDEAIAKVREKKTFLRTYDSFAKELLKKDGDLVKIQALLSSLDTFGAHIPRGAAIRVWKMTCLDLVRQRKFVDLAAKLIINDTHPIEINQVEALAFNKTVVEVGFQRLVGLVSGLKTESDRAHISKILDMCNALVVVKPILSDENAIDVATFGKALDHDEHGLVTYAEQEAAINYLAEKKEADTYFGVLKAALEQAEFGNVLAFARQSLAEKSGGSGEAESLISILNKVKSKEYTAGWEGFNDTFVDLAQKLMDEEQPKAGSIKLFKHVMDETLKVMQSAEEHSVESCECFLGSLVAAATAKSGNLPSPMPTREVLQAFVETQKRIGIHSPLGPQQIKAFANRKCDFAQPVATSRQMQRNAERLLQFAAAASSIVDGFHEPTPDIAKLTQAYAKCDDLLKELSPDAQCTLSRGYNELRSICNIGNVCKPRYEAEWNAIKVLRPRRQPNIEQHPV